MGTRALCSETVLTLLDSGFLDPRATDCDNNTLLHLAIEQNNKKLVNGIVTYYMEARETDAVKKAINMKNVANDTPLHVAARHFPRSELTLALMEAGAKTGIRNNANQVVVFEDDEEEEEEPVTTPSILMVTPMMVTPPRPRSESKELMPELSSATLPEWLTFEDTKDEEADDILGPFRLG